MFLDAIWENWIAPRRSKGDGEETQVACFYVEQQNGKNWDDVECNC